MVQRFFSAYRLGKTPMTRWLMRTWPVAVLIQRKDFTGAALYLQRGGGTGSNGVSCFALGAL